MDLTIEGKAYINGSFERCCIGVRGGEISAIKKVLKGDRHIDVGKKLILPSGIDIHVHFRDPGFVHKEDFSTGSFAAAFGGITCVFDMPNTQPPTLTVRSVLEKIKIAERKSFVDYGLYAGVTDDNVENISELAKHCNGFKIFLGSTTNPLELDEEYLRKAFREIDQTTKLTLIHAEDQQCLKKHGDTEYSLKDHLRCRPSTCEEKAIRNILMACGDISSKIHICHLSSCEGFEALRARPKNVSVGVTPHHLFFNYRDISLKQTLYKVNPPIRLSLDRETLWYGMKNNVIDVLESDHAPHTLEEKDVDFNLAPSGMPGVETMYPLLLAEVKKEHLSFQRLLSLLCERPAELLDIPKGKIEVGREADLIVVDFKEETKIRSDNLHSKCDWTPYEDWSAIFPTDVFVRGEKLIEDDEIQVDRGFGRFVGA